MEDDVAAGRLDALVLKLRHPLVKIRSRALRSLLFKLRERLVRWQELEPLQTSLVPSLLACLEPPLELETLHVLQLLVQSQSEVLLASLQHFGAAQKLQQAANKNPELQATYEKLLRQIYVTKLASVEENRNQISRLKEKKEQSDAAEEEFRASRVSSDRRRAPKVDELEAQGWRFAHVTLTSVDEQYLFEFEVKLQLKTEIQDIVTACAKFRDELLRNFPAEVFLQRPAVLQHLLHLVQQPILPGSSEVTSKRGEDGDIVMEKAMEVSMGVNYFDEMLNSTFSSKRGNLTGAVVMASLKAIESFLYALQLTWRSCLDPTYVMYAPQVQVELFDSYDSRRVLYPRARVEIGLDASRQRGGESGDQLEQYSLSGALYRIFISVLPLLRSARHPRLHFLNLLIVALPDLPEKSHLASAASNVQKLNKLRLQHIFGVLSGICRPVPLEQVGNNIMDDDLELTHSMTWKLVELVLKLLRLYPSSRYRVEQNSSKTDCDRSSGTTDESSAITIPRPLWDAVKLWITSPVFPELSSKEWKNESVVQFLAKIDSTIPAFVNLKHSSLQDAKLILYFVKSAKLYLEQLAKKFGPWEKPDAVTLEVAKKAIQARYVFDSTDNEIIADAALQTIWSALIEGGKDKTGRIAESDIETMQFILSDMLSGSGEMETAALHDSMVARFFRGFVDLVEEPSNGAHCVSADCRHQFITEVICEPKFLAFLLLILARQDGDTGDKVNNAAFWELLRIAFTQLASSSNEKLVLLQPVVPLLQHFAYMEPSVGCSREQRSTQPQLAEVLNRMETIVSDHTRKLMLCRCLLHQSSYIRKAASSGVIRLLSQATPSYVESISKDKSIFEDPFGGTIDCDGRNLNFDAALMETPLPTIHVGCQPSENELSSQLRKLAHLCKVVSGTSSAFESMREAALKELVMFIEHLSVKLFTLLEEMDKLSCLIDLLRSFLHTKESRHDSSMVQQALILFRTLLLRSRLLRSAIQRDSDMMELLMASIFHTSVSVRAQMYYILLLLTCSSENFIPSGVPAESLTDDKLGRSGEEARIPEMIKATFGLYSGRWTRCQIVNCSLKQQLQASCALLTKRTDSSWLQEVRAIINQTPFRSDEDDVKNDANSKKLSTLLGAEYAIIAQKLRDAPSHGKCLNALYHLMTMCEAWHFGREHFVGEWEADFERYFGVPPKSERDEVIIGSLVATLSVMFSVMTRGEQLRALVVVKRKVLPLLKRSQSKAFSLQVARLLLNVSESKVGDLFLSLAADTDIVATICTKYSAIYATEPVLHGLMLDVLLRFAKGIHEDADTHLSAPSRDKICKRLLEMLSPLLTVVCRHRVPGSFLERDVFVVGSQCMITILRMLPPNSLLASDCPLEHTDSSILLDGSWASRFLFDHVSPIRELGFLVIEHASSSIPPPTRLLEMVFETSTDDTESDAVRAAACTALTKEILLYHERSSDQQAAMLKSFHGTKFSGKVLRSLSHVLKGNKLCARASSAFARLVRVLYVQRDSVATIFGDMQKELDAAGEEYEVYRLLVQALSLREWKYNCDCYCSRCMLLPSCDDSTWRRSLLPAILDLMSEVLNLFQATCRNAGFDQVDFFLKHMTLHLQLMELVRDVHASFDNSFSAATKQRHYEVLDLCAGTLSILLVQAFDHHGKYNPRQLEAPTTPGFEADFVGVVAKLLGSHHPIDFRVSFSRIVPSIWLLIPGWLKSSDTSVVNVLGSVVLDLYQEVAEFRHLDANTIAPAMQEVPSRLFPLTFIRRVSCALQVLLELNPNLQQLVRVKRALPFTMASIKESFSAIRIAGGFGGKRGRNSNTSSNTHDAYVLDLCGRVQTHIEVMSAIVGGDRESQQQAKGEGLLGVFLSNWSVIKMAHVRGSRLMLRALHLLANYTYGNDNARGSMLISLQSRSAKISGSESAQTLLSLVFDLASFRGEMASSHRQVARGAIAASAADMTVSNAACQVVKAVLLNTECVLASIKTGSISRLLDSLQDRLKQARQTSKTNHLEAGNLAHMLGVLSSVASNEEGARVLYTNWANVLSLVFDDVMHSSDEVVQRSGCLFLRNLALSRAAKNHFAMWKELLDDMIALCIRASSTTRVDLTIVSYLSAALWSLVYDNQKARALLLSRPTSLRKLQHVLCSQNAASQQTSSQDITENLRRVLMLVKE